ncbi:MAG: hypothetical protein ABIX01_17220 [Chitinophagaceae bacterium]
MAQKTPLSNIRQKMIAVQRRPLQFDTLSLVPNTFFLKGFSKQQYKLSEADAMLDWTELPEMDSVAISYRVFPFRLNTVSRRYLYDSIANKFVADPLIFNRNNRKNAENKLLDFGTLTYSGSLGRSLSFGNSQDAVVNSSFNLQLNGMLGDSIQVAAAITDNNIPIQPDGTTQQLNEFDRIFLQFKKRPWQVDLGDIDLRQTNFYFLNFYKRLQGLSFQTENRVSKNITNKLTATGAVAKGKFTRNIFPGLEGNQGPYRLTGANNELFFVVLAGTERVFIDGVAMQPGEDQDYVINYNTAEVTFTPRQMITKDKRIQIEFEYADRNYLNYLVYAGNELQIGKKLKVSIGAYSNSDSKNSPINQTLDKGQKQFLSQLGDSVQTAFYPTAYLDTFAVGKILYVKKDSVVNGVAYPIYLYQAFQAGNMFGLSFAELGQGRGNYIPAFNAANGKVYLWVAPVNGVPQGNYEPVSLLVAPKKQQLATIKTEYRISDKAQGFVEGAFSKWDVNTFSAKDKGNDVGGALRLGVNDSRSVLMGKKKLDLNSTLGYEYVSEKFKPLERLRSVEFLRDWGLPFTLTNNVTEQLPSAAFELRDANANSVQYSYQGYTRSDGYQGHRQSVTNYFNYKGWQLNDQVMYTSISGTTYSGFLLRPVLRLNKVLKNWHDYIIGGSFYMDHNQLGYRQLDSLSPASFSFKDWTAYIRSNQAKDNRWSLTYTSRANSLPQKNAFVKSDVSHNFSGLVELLKNSHHQFRLNATYRILQIKNQAITTQKPEDNLLGRAEYITNMLKGMISANLLYELGAGQEQRRDFSYVEVPAGQGEFTWIDYNNDGIQQLNEFETALFQDQAKFIRVFTPTNQFIKAAYNTLNYSLVISPRNFLTRPGMNSLEKMLAKVILQSTLQTTRKAISTNKFQLDPFKGSVSDTNLISLANTFANTLSYNRSSTVWGFDINQNFNTNKAILTYGFETRKYRDWAGRIRWNIGRRYTIEMLERLNRQGLTVPNPKFDNRNYLIKTVSVEPKFTYTAGSVFRIAGSFRGDWKQGSNSTGNEPCTIQSINIETKYTILQSALLNAKLTFSNISYAGPTNNTIAFIILDGLQPGKNILWSADFTKRLANSLELNFQYEGRKPGSGNTVHIGRASLRALF